MKNKESYIARRRFLCGMVGGGAAALGATAAGPLAAYVGILQSVPLPEFLIIPPADYALAPGQSKLMRYGPVPILLLRTPEPESELKVFWATCTHLTCTVGYKPEENIILCACHNGRFDLDGTVLGGPPPAPLPEFKQRKLEDERLVIALEEENLDKALEQKT